MSFVLSVSLDVVATAFSDKLLQLFDFFIATEFAGSLLRFVVERLSCLSDFNFAALLGFFSVLVCFLSKCGSTIGGFTYLPSFFSGGGWMTGSTFFCSDFCASDSS